MEKLSIEEIIEAVSGTLISKGVSREVAYVSTDTRTVTENDLFIALEGERYDAHKFIHQAFDKKCKAVLVSKSDVDIPDHVTAVLVENTLKAIGDIAAYYRKKMGFKVIAVTGSNGKTTTKDIIGSLLQNFVEVTVTRGTENNLIGVPSTILSADKSKKALVLELGINHFGEMRRLGAIAQPDTVIVTNILASHVEYLIDEDGVFKAKSEICEHLNSNSHLILNRNSKYFDKYNELVNCSVVSFGIDVEADYTASEIKYFTDETEFCLSIKNEKLGSVRIPVKGSHNVLNFLSAVAAIESLGFKWDKIRQYLSYLALPKMRLEIQKLGDFFIINDAYNANPASTRIAINELVRFSTDGRKIMVFGNMMELGEKSEYYHRQIGKDVAENNIDIFISYGDMAKAAAEEINGKDTKVYSVDNLDGLFDLLKGIMAENDVVLLKGSRANRLEKVIDKLNNYYSKESVI